MPKTYTTTQGDTWDMISLRVYGTEKHLGELIAANPAHRETVFFSANTQLVIPVVAVVENSKLPPWKRGG